MMHCFRRFAPALALVLTGSLAHAQFVNRLKKDDASISVGGTGQFSTVLTSNPTPVAFSNPTATTVQNQRQDTTWSAGLVASMQLHPVSWAGIALNYGYTHYDERYSFTYANSPAIARSVSVPTDWHEATAGYLVHPKHIPFQPYMVIGGGAIDFAPSKGTTQFNGPAAPNQWRGAGLLEAGFDLPVKGTHFGFRVSGRSLYYRAPNYNTAQISTRSWRVTSEPAVSTYYRF
jgi:hypothetical protein